MGSTMQRQPDGLPLGFVADFDRASSALENSVLALLAGGWDEGPRRLAPDMAAALRLAMYMTFTRASNSETVRNNANGNGLRVQLRRIT